MVYISYLLYPNSYFLRDAEESKRQAERERKRQQRLQEVAAEDSAKAEELRKLEEEERQRETARSDRNEGREFSVLVGAVGVEEGSGEREGESWGEIYSKDWSALRKKREQEELELRKRNEAEELAKQKEFEEKKKKRIEQQQQEEAAQEGV